MQVQAGDAYAGQDLRVVFKLALPSLAVLGPAKIADVVLRYVSVGDEVAAHEVTYPLLVNLVSADEAATAVHADLASGAFSAASSKSLRYNSRTMRRKRGGPRP